MTKIKQIYAWIQESYSHPGVDQHKAIPSINKLVEQFSASKGTVEKALVKLVKDGVLRSEPKRGYFPVPMTGRPGTLDLALGTAYFSRDEGHIFSRILAGFALAASEAGRDLRIFSSFVDDDREAAVDGMLLKAASCQMFGVAGLGVYSDPFFVGLRDLRVPAVSLDYDTAALGVDCVTTDSRRDACALVFRLLEMGHRGIACVGGQRLADGSFEDPDHGLRIEGYKDALAAKGVQFREENVLSVEASGRPAVQRALIDLTRRNKVTAVLIDSHTLKALESVLYSKELSLEFAIFQDKSFTPPACAECVVSARYDFREMGRMGVDLLLKRIGSGFGRASRVLLEPEII